MNQFCQIQVNGEARTARSGITVADLLREIEVKPDRVAVELNLEILDRQEFDRRNLSEGDRIEIISFIGGGSRELSVISSQFSARGRKNSFS
ncbi:MAG: sulfur carrier protein ThiS [Nitrospira sp.]|nr:sulfur carrier protein ThiS [Nitrospira sp.]